MTDSLCRKQKLEDSFIPCVNGELQEEMVMKLIIVADVDNFSQLGCWTVQSHLHTK